MEVAVLPQRYSAWPRQLDGGPLNGRDEGRLASFTGPLPLLDSPARTVSREEVGRGHQVAAAITGPWVSVEAGAELTLSPVHRRR